jgi:hypothetical protein
MFLWKNAIVLCALLGMVTIPATMLVRARWENLYMSRIVICGMLIACIAVSALSMAGTQLVFGLLLILCFDKRVPMAATYLFFFFWAPAAGALLGVAGAYIAPLTPFMSFSAALLLGYLLHPESYLQRRFVMSDAWMLLFVVLFCVCASLHTTATGVARNIVTYFIPYALSYFILSRVRVERPELVLRLILFGAAAGAMLCIFETLRGWPLYAGVMGVKNELWTIDSPRVWLERGGINRAYGPYSHPLVGGTLLGIAAIAAWAFYLARGRSVPLLLLAATIVLGLAVTLSRSGLVALAVGLMVFQALRGRYLLAILMPIVGAMGVIGFPLFAGEDVNLSGLYRLDLIVGVPRVLGSRIWLGYRGAMEEGLLDQFIQGQGIVDLVNTYLGIAVEGGVVSVVPYVIFLLSTFPHYRAIRRLRPDREQLLLAQALVSMQAGLIAGMALLGSWASPMQLSFVVTALVIALRFEIARARSAEAPKPVPLVAVAPAYEGEQLPALR